MKKFSFLAITALLLIATSCNKGKIDLPTDSVSLYKGDTYQIEASSEKTINYSSENRFHATVNQKGFLIANHVGTTTIKLETEKDSKDFTVNVIPVSNLYTEIEPCFNLTRSEIQNKFGEPSYIDEEAYTYYYPDNEKAPFLQMLFENDHVVAYTYFVSKSCATELNTFLNERYCCYGLIGDGIKAYYNDLDYNDATLIIFTLYNPEIQMNIIQYQSLENSQKQGYMFQDMQKNFEHILSYFCKK